MSSKQYEDASLKSKRGCYKPLGKAWEYSCPKTNINYSAFSNGINCLCANSPADRSTFDQYMIAGKKWPTSNPSLGWNKSRGCS